MAVAIGVSGSGAATDEVPVTFEVAGGESMQLPTVWEGFVCSQGPCSLETKLWYILINAMVLVVLVLVVLAVALAVAV